MRLDPHDLARLDADALDAAIVEYDLAVTALAADEVATAITLDEGGLITSVQGVRSGGGGTEPADSDPIAADRMRRFYLDPATAEEWLHGLRHLAVVIHFARAHSAGLIDAASWPTTRSTYADDPQGARRALHPDFISTEGNDS